MVTTLDTALHHEKLDYGFTTIGAGWSIGATCAGNLDATSPDGDSGRRGTRPTSPFQNVRTRDPGMLPV